MRRLHVPSRHCRRIRTTTTNDHTRSKTRWHWGSAGWRSISFWSMANCASVTTDGRHDPVAHSTRSISRHWLRWSTGVVRGGGGGSSVSAGTGDQGAIAGHLRRADGGVATLPSFVGPRRGGWDSRGARRGVGGLASAPNGTRVDSLPGIQYRLSRAEPVDAAVLDPRAAAQRGLRKTMGRWWRRSITRARWFDAIRASKAAVPDRLLRVHNVPQNADVYAALFAAGVDLIGTKQPESTAGLIRPSAR